MNVTIVMSLVQFHIRFDLSDRFWAPGKQNDTLVYYAACCDSDGKWTKGPYESKTFICEK